MDPTVATTTTGPNLFPVLNILSGAPLVHVWGGIILPFFESILHGLAPYSLFLSLLFLTGIIYSTIQITRIRTIERAFYKEAAAKARASVEGAQVGHNPKWERVIARTESPNPNDWRLAILDADIMLEEMVDVMGHHGETLGDKLKNIERSDFTTIDKAWEAHRVRNQIAHEGAEFLLSDREAKRIINLYRDVFNEFHYI